MGKIFAEIAILNALDKTLHYVVPPELHTKVQVGIRVLIPLGRREATGVVVGIQQTPPALSRETKLRSLRAALDPFPVVPPDLVRLCQWIAKYYFFPLGEVIQTALPSGIQCTPLTFYRKASGVTPDAIGEVAPELLTLFSEKENVSQEEILTGHHSLHHMRKKLKSLEEKGLVERFHQWQLPQARPKKIPILFLVAKPAGKMIEKNDTPKRLISLLEEAGGSLPIKTLRQRVQNASYWIQKLKREGVVKVEQREEVRESHCAQLLHHPCTGFELTPDQQKLMTQILAHVVRPTFQPFLIHGVTGSGKTEIYLHIIEKVIQEKKSAIVLVPEIALSTQMEALFRHRFGARLAVWHSGLSPGTRYDQWREILSGKRRVILGVRSAIFMPVEDLGLIIVDEEHDPSYKQEDRLRYHARDVALMRARMLQIPIVLGSATPSLQSFFHAKAHRYILLSLPRRVFDRPLPLLRIVDMRRETRQSQILSQYLREALSETIQRGEQALIFLNRRGFATFLLCHSCGHVLQCSHCSVSLTYHKEVDLLRCHYCGWERTVPERCHVCDHPSLVRHGFGTERVEEEIRTVIPGARIVRIDRDTVHHARQIVEHLNAVRHEQANILIGTQMVAKGHDFPSITLVGIINADTALQIADFRAGETTVQLLMQVAGRAGRGEKPGQVILQTYNPQHYTIEAITNMDYPSFCTKELESRERLQYPPFTRFVRFLVSAPQQETARRDAQSLASLCREVTLDFRQRQQHLAMLGPAPAPLFRLQRRYRWHIFVKAWTNQDIQQFTETLMIHIKSSPTLRRAHIAIDRDPMTSL